MATLPLTGAPPSGTISPAPRRAVAGWTIFDLANSLAMVIIVTNTFPRWFAGNGGSDGALGTAFSVATLVTLLGAAPLGLALDRTNRRVLPLAIFTGVCIIAMLLFEPAGIPGALLPFAVAVWAMQTGQLAYDALISDVAISSSRAHISGIGIALGYVGSFAGIALDYALRAGGAPVGQIFRIGALAFLVLALPCLLWVKERPRQAADAPTTGDQRGFAALVAPLRDNPALRRLALTDLLFAATWQTMILFGAIYASQTVGLSPAMTSLALVIVSLVAIPSALASGHIAQRYGARRAYIGALGLWTLSLLLLAAVPLLGLPPLSLLGIMVLIGIGLAAAFTTQRPLLVALGRQHQVGQSFGTLAVTTRTAAIAGPLLWALVADWLGIGRPAAVLLLFALAVAAVLLARTIADPDPAR
jgi:MFS transporter, UMF1 family